MGPRMLFVPVLVACGAPAPLPLVLESEVDLGVFLASWPLEGSFTVLAATDVQIAEVRLDDEAWRVVSPADGLVDVTASTRLPVTLATDGLEPGEHQVLVEFLALDGTILASTYAGALTEEPVVTLSEEVAELGAVPVGSQATAQWAATNASPFPVELSPTKLTSSELSAPLSPWTAPPGVQVALAVDFRPTTSSGSVAFDVAWSVGPWPVGTTRMRAEVPSP
ncbi:MAG: hypothetical protein H6732_13210 [Alphaproteobacteria bacterium]|nr:hypothetical protein [Alphaproteobacteria bacterium]